MNPNPRQPRSKILIIIVVIALLGATAGFFILRQAEQKQTKPEPTPQTTVAATIKTADFTYEKPTDWILLAKERLDSIEAVTGIGRPPGLSASFTVKVSSSTPKSNDELKNSTLDDIKKNAPNFELISSEATTIDGHAGQKFIYKYGDTSKTKQELSVIVNKQKTFFLLFVASEPDFDKYTANFTQILSSFKFL